MTAAEGALLTILRGVDSAPEQARLLAADLLGARRVESTLMAAAAVAAAFADAGSPIG